MGLTFGAPGACQRFAGSPLGVERTSDSMRLPYWSSWPIIDASAANAEMAKKKTAKTPVRITRRARTLATYRVRPCHPGQGHDAPRPTGAGRDVKLNTFAARCADTFHDKLRLGDDFLAGVTRLAVARTAPEARDAVLGQATVSEFVPNEATKGFLFHWQSFGQDARRVRRAFRFDSLAPQLVARLVSMHDDPEADYALDVARSYRLTAHDTWSAVSSTGLGDALNGRQGVFRQSSDPPPQCIVGHDDACHRAAARPCSLTTDPLPTW